MNGPLNTTMHMNCSKFYFFFSSRRRHTTSVSAFLLNRSSDLLASISRWITASSSWKRFCLFIHITIIELNALHTKRQNLFQELDAVIHLLMEAKHWGLRKSRNATKIGRASCRENVALVAGARA